MKRVNLLMLLLVSAGLLLSCSKEDAESPELMWSNAMSEKGNGDGNAAPFGMHYNLNVIGVERGKTADMTGNTGDRIFVGFEGLTKINLTSGADLQVMDADATDGVAEFHLPNPEINGDGTTDYSIWVRPLETADNAILTACAAEEGYVEICSAEYLEVAKTTGSESGVKDVAVQLLTIYLETEISFTDAGGSEVILPAGRHAIFDEIFEDYFWYYDTNGLRILQLRFYEVL
jgi:hypothetical protein